MGSLICNIILVHASIIEREVTMQIPDWTDNAWTSRSATYHSYASVTVTEHLMIPWQGMMFLFFFEIYD